MLRYMEDQFRRILTAIKQMGTDLRPMCLWTEVEYWLASLIRLTCLSAEIFLPNRRLLRRIQTASSRMQATV